MKIFHRDLRNLLTLLGYNPYHEYDSGICRGFCFASLYAVVTNDEQTFYERLKLISTYKEDNDKNNFAKLVEEITEARLKVKQKIPLSEHEEKILTIPSMFETILLHLSPKTYL